MISQKNGPCLLSLCFAANIFLFFIWEEQLVMFGWQGDIAFCFALWSAVCRPIDYPQTECVHCSDTDTSRDSKTPFATTQMPKAMKRQRNFKVWFVISSTSFLDFLTSSQHSFSMKNKLFVFHFSCCQCMFCLVLRQ